MASEPINKLLNGKGTHGKIKAVWNEETDDWTVTTQLYIDNSITTETLQLSEQEIMQKVDEFVTDVEKQTEYVNYVQQQEQPT